jgi:hypothetical protein
VNKYRNDMDYRDPYQEDIFSDMSEEDSDSWCHLSRMQLQHLTGLVDLSLLYVALAPAELAGATQMQRLVLSSFILWPQGEGDTAEAIGELLSTLACYTQLQHLHLGELEMGRSSGALAHERFAALTASPMLTHLDVSGQYGLPPLPSGTVQHMFPAGRQLPLRELVLLPSYGHGVSDNVDAESSCVTGAELSSMVRACPELQQLVITGAVHPGDMSGLLQLPPSCTEMCIGGPAMSDAEVPVVRQLTQLIVLRWWDSPGLTDVGVEQLTALTQLSALEVRRCDGLSQGAWGAPRTL